MFLHCVYYWLKPDLSDVERAAFFQGIETLKKLDSVRRAWFGTPADGGEPAADRTYTHALLLGLDGEAGHDAFQADPEHQAVRDRIGGSWDRILIHDIEG